MKRRMRIKHEFVDYIPHNLKEGTIYISINFATAAHKCFCGCGGEVITPLSPEDWELTFDGKSITLNPSIGNWSFNCQSHYWIIRNTIRWARKWSQDEIDACRSEELHRGKKYFTDSTKTRRKRARRYFGF